MNKPVLEKNMLVGPVGPIESLLSVSKDNKSHIAVVCHPHPLYEGSMENKVVHYTTKALNEMGVPALRFNFRGVGHSAGQFDDTRGEAQDLEACVDWLRRRYPERRLVLAGFSFGSYIVAMMAARLHASALVTIAPAVNLYRYDEIERPGCPWLVIQGSEDEVVPAGQVSQWAESSPDINKLVWMPGASHFFHGKLLVLSDAIQTWFRQSFDMD